MMYYKTPEIKDQFLTVIPCFLRLLVEDANVFIEKHFHKSLTITRVNDRVKGESGVHPACRGVDARDFHDGYYTFTPLQVSKILTYINTKYKRYDRYLTLKHHTAADGCAHFHFQVSYSMETYIPC